MDSDAWNERYLARDDLVWAEAPNRFVESECASITPGRALDLACGEGRNAVWLAGLGWRVTAVDWADAAIDKGRALALRRGVNVEWVVADLLTYEPERSSYDLVVLSYLQVPPGDRSIIWPAAASAVAPGGTIMVVGHHSRNLHEGWGGPREPAVLYTPADVVATLDADGGFDIVRADEVQRPVEIEDGTRATAIDCLVKAVRRR
ncbi:MAG: class I SAM-dependent methyltransferase [Acidimicrobiia bacterium]|nr:class I SAM-dependent methyltransferase [Acidimicrobiia bacterium]